MHTMKHTPLNPTSHYVLVETLRPFVDGPAVAVLDEIREDGTRLAGPTVPWAVWVDQAISQGTAKLDWRKTCRGAEQAPRAGSTRSSDFDRSTTLGACRDCTAELRVRKDGRITRHGCDLVVWPSGLVEPKRASQAPA